MVLPLTPPVTVAGKLFAGVYALYSGFAVLVITLSAMAFYAMSLAPIVWVLISELFPNRIRGAAVSVAVSALWISCFILTYTFPLLRAAVGLLRSPAAIVVLPL